MELKLIIKKRKFWQSKWKIQKPTLYILEYKDNDWINTYWWAGNWHDKTVKFNGPAECKITQDFEKYLLETINIKYKVVGNTGTDLIVDGRKIKGYPGNKPGWTIFGYIESIVYFKKSRSYKKELL